MQRRQFLKSSCNACLLAASGLLFLPALEGCAPGAYKVYNAEVVQNQLSIPLEQFTQSPLVLVRPKGWFYNVAVRKKNDNTYTALLLQCTHQENQLTAAGNSYTCSLHGSTFNLDGQVIKGPAETALQSFPVSIVNNQLVIHTKA